MFSIVISELALLVMNQERKRVQLYFLSFTLNLTCFISVLWNWNICNRKTWISLHLFYLQFSVMSQGQTLSRVNLPPSLPYDMTPPEALGCVERLRLRLSRALRYLGQLWVSQLVAGSWTRWPFKAPSHPNHFRIWCNACPGLAVLLESWWHLCAFGDTPAASLSLWEEWGPLLLKCKSTVVLWKQNSPWITHHVVKDSY